MSTPGNEPTANIPEHAFNGMTAEGKSLYPTPDAPYTPTNAAAFVCEPTEHHWISSHEPNAPIWIIQCSLCGRHNFEEMLAAHDAEVEAAARAQALGEAVKLLSAEGWFSLGIDALLDATAKEPSND